MTGTNLQDVFRAELDAHQHAAQSLAAFSESLTRAANILADSIRAGGKLLTCGNGGSATDAAHLATEFVIRLYEDRKPLAAICLNESGSTLTAGSNDYGFDHIFERQVRGLGKRGDVLVALSTSGNSKNVLLAIEAAKRIGVRTIAFLGRDGGLTKGVADVELIVPGDSTARTQECHMILYHALCKMVEAALGGCGGEFLSDRARPKS
jgi:D-sedoheptulose 7-phosphate isomerase